MASQNNKTSEFIDLRAIVQEWMSKWYWFIISVIVCVGIAWFYTKIKKPVYLTEANIVISQDDKSGLGGLGDITDMLGSTGKVDDEVFVVSSHSVLKSVVRELGINKNHVVRQGFMNKKFAYKDFPVEIYPAEDYADTLRASLTFKISVDKNGKVEITAKKDRKTLAEVEAKSFPVTVETSYGKFVFNKTNNYVNGKKLKTTITYGRYDGVAEDLAEDVNISIASRKSNVILMSMKSTDIDFSRDILNEIIRYYNIRCLEQKNAEGNNTLKFLNARLELIENDLISSESDVENYKRGHRIVDVQAEAVYQTSKKAKFESQLVEQETELEIIKMTRDFLADPENAYQLIPTTVATEALKNGISSYNQLIISRMDLLKSAKESNRTLKKINEQIDAVRASIIESLDRTYDQQLLATNELRSHLGGTSSKLGDIPTQEREYREIARKQTVKEQLYVFLLKRREETAMLIANATPKGIIVDEAFALQEPVSMKKIVILAIAFLIGICIVPVILYLKKLFNNKFETVKDVERLTDIPVLGEVCTSRSGKSLVVSAANATNSTSELFRLIRTNLQFVLNGKDDKVILMTSTTSGEGKSFISINLSSSLALLHKRVVLVGLDIRAPKLTDYLDLPAKKGVTDFLSNDNVTLDDIVRRDAVEKGMDIITSGPIPPNPSELLAGNRLQQLIDELRERYDYVILDSAPVGMVSDSLSLARVADATIYVCRANYTTISDVEYFNKLYNEKRLPKLSLIVNGTSAKKGYGYGYGEKSNG